MTNTSPLPSRSGQVFVSVVITAGVLAVLQSLTELWKQPVTYHWFVLAGLTLLSGSFTIRIPTIPARLSVSETFVFAAVLLFGTAGATLIVVLDSLVISLWLKQRSRRPSRVLFNMAAPSVAIWIAANAFYWLAQIPPLAQQPQPQILALVAPLLVLAILYFLLNSFLIAVAIAFENCTSALRVWRQNFLWLSLNYFSGASVAALLLPYLQADYEDFIRLVGVLLPLLLISYLTFKTALGRVDDANRHLSELNRLYLSTIETLAMAIDAKDQITHGHIRRVQTYAVLLARAVGVTDNDQIRAIEAAALLHDMGKLAVPEYILNKPGALTTTEFEKMKVHASVGADILSAIEFPYPVVPIVRHHHENWNGSGYPDGLSGSDIPIGARVLSVVDCYDALTSDRPYRPKLSDADAIKILLDRRGTMYDPLVVDTFLRIQPTFRTGTTASALDNPQSLAAITDAALPSEPEGVTLRSLAEITASADEMLSIFRLSKVLAGQAELSDGGEIILQHIRRLIPYSTAVLYVYEPEFDELVGRYAFGEHAALIRGIRVPLGQRLTGWVGAHRHTIRNSDPVLDLGEMIRALDPRPRAALTVALVDSGDLVGALSLYATKREAFSEDHERIIEVLGPHISPVVRQTVKMHAARAVTFRDQVTGLPNFEQLRRFSHECGSTKESGVPAVVHLLVQNLKIIMTAHGRDVADRVLIEIVKSAQRHLRSTDVMFRCGFDELVVIFLKSTQDEAKAVTSIIDRSVESAVELHGVIRPTVVVRLVCAPADGTSIEELVRVARSGHVRGASEGGDPGRRAGESIH